VDPGGGGPDTCWLSTDNYDPFIRITSPPPYYWSVDALNNSWGWDYVGYSSDQVTYYRNSGRAECGTSFPQKMQISCQDTNTYVPYRLNTLAATIEATTVSATRDGNQQPTTWP
jgi:hypothetical protein